MKRRNVQRVKCLVVFMLCGVLCLTGTGLHAAEEYDITYDEVLDEEGFTDENALDPEGDLLLAGEDTFQEDFTVPEDALEEGTGQLAEEIPGEGTEETPEGAELDELSAEDLFEDLEEDSNSLHEETITETSGLYMAEPVSGTKITLGSDMVTPGNMIWFGMDGYNDSTGVFDPLPSGWKVLNKADGKAVLIVDRLIGETIFNYPLTKGNNWQGSDAQNWCSIFYGKWTAASSSSRVFVIEKAMIVSDNVKDEPWGDYGESELKSGTDYFYFLSAEEAATYFKDNSSRISLDVNGSAQYWILRSPYAEFANTYYEGTVGSSGDFGANLVNQSLGARPAFNMNLSSVLFTSAAADGKSSGIPGAGALTAVEKNYTGDWKLTLRDDNREFKASFDQDSAETFETSAEPGYSDWFVMIKYQGAQTGNREYVSAILTDANDNVLYYGNIAQNSASGTQKVNIPAGLQEGTYKLLVFSEQKNGDKLSDLASKFQMLDLKVCTHTPETVITKATPDNNGASVQKCSKCGEELNRSVITKANQIKLTTASYTYNGKARKPSVTVADSGGTALPKDAYTVTYSDNVNAGTATAIVTLQGKYYAGTKKLTFTIEKAANPVKAKAKKLTLDVGKLQKENQTFTAQKAFSVSKAKGKVTYQKLSGVKKISISESGKVTVMKGLPKGTYTVKVKVTAAGNSNYKKKSITLKLQIKITGTSTEVWKTVANLKSGYLAIRSAPAAEYGNELNHTGLKNGDRVQIKGKYVQGTTFSGGKATYVWVYVPKYKISGYVNAAYLK